jgi:activating signal cointegrator complex subunit 2
VLYDKEFLNPIVHFLQESTPFYLTLTDNHAVNEIYEKICRNVIVIVCRLVTNRESDEEYISKEKHAEILYDNFILTIPMIFDMLVLYGFSNKSLIHKIINTMLKIEPKYVKDMKSGIKFIHSSFSVLKEQLVTVEKENRDLFQKYEDITLYLMNIAVTINLLIDLLPNEIKLYCSKELRLEAAIANMYDNFISTLCINSHEVEPSAWYLAYIDFARIELIYCFRNLLNRPILAIFNASEKNRVKFADEILSILSECAGYHSFIEDYIKLYPIEMDLDVITQSGKKV